jgi:hypothetical protein
MAEKGQEGSALKREEEEEEEEESTFKLHRPDFEKVNRPDSENGF